MNPAFNLSLTKEQIVDYCGARQIRISAVEVLPDGGTRLVCASSSGAAEIQAKLGRKIMSGAVRRTSLHSGPLW